MSLNKALGGALIVQLAILGTLVFMPAQAQPQPASAAEPFDHSNCQYPDRTTNPADGCDNSDPCDPAQTKGGSGDCLPIGTAEKQQAIAEYDAAFNQPAPAKAECAGK